MTILEGFSEFHKYYLLGNDYSQKTVDGYWWIMRSLTEGIGNIELAQLDQEAYLSWRRHMTEKGNKALTIHSNVSKFKKFVEFFYEKGECPLNPHEIRTPKKPKQNVKYAPRDRVDAMIAACTTIRDKAILATLFSTGLRNAELRSLKRVDVMAEGVVNVEQGKGAKDGVVFLSNQAKELYDRYQQSRTDDSPYAFVTNRGDRVAPSTLRYIVQYAAKRAGVEHTSPHQLRHGLGTELMKQGVHMRYIQEALRHESIQTTQIYTHVEKPDLRKELNRVLNQDHKVVDLSTKLD